MVGVAGRPVKKDKMFFFFNTEGLRVLIPTSPLVVTPSPQFEAATITNLQNAGRPDVASFYQNQIFSNLNNSPNANSALDNQIHGQFTDSSGQVQLTGDGCGGFDQATPPPYSFIGAGAQPCALGYRAAASNFSHELQFAGRVDYIAGAKDRVFVHVQRDSGTQATYTDPISSVFNVQSSQPEGQGQLEWTHAFGPSTANQSLVAGQWYSAIFDTANPTSGTFPTTLALANETFFNTAGPNPCSNAPLGQGPVLLGGRGCMLPNGRSSAQVQVSDDLSKTFGRQTIKIGGEFRRVDVSDHDFGQLQSGLLTVNTINDFYNGGATGDTFTQSFPQSLNEPIAYYTAGGYLERRLALEQDTELYFRAARGARFESDLQAFVFFATGGSLQWSGGHKLRDKRRWIADLQRNQTSVFADRALQPSHQRESVARTASVREHFV